MQNQYLIHFRKRGNHSKSYEHVLLLEQPGPTLWRIEEEQDIAKKLKLTNRNPRNQPNFHDTEMHVTNRI